MGKSASKEQRKENVHANGQVNNSFVIEESVGVHNDEVIIILYVICGIKILELLIYLYKLHKKEMKKKFIQQHAPGKI